MSGIMSSPAPMAQSPRRALGEINNQAPMTPDTPSRKRQKTSASPAKITTSACTKLLFQQPYREHSLVRSLVDNSGFDLSKYSQSEALGFVSRESDRDSLPDLAPWLHCPPSDCRPFSVAAFHHSNNVAIGLQGGHVCLSNSGFNDASRKTTRPHMGISSVTNDAILDIDVSHCDTLVGCAGGDGTVHVFDPQNKMPVYKANFPGIRLKKLQFHHENRNLLLTGDNTGAMNLIDLRIGDGEPKMAAFDNTFASTSQQFDKRRMLGITALTWTGEHTAASACESHSMVKLWDFRKLTKKGASAGTTPAPLSQKRHFGVTSLVHDPVDHKIWALCRDSHIYSYRAYDIASGVVDNLSSSTLKVDSFYPKMALIQDKTKSGSYLACGGDGITVFAKPANGVPTTSTQATVVLNNGHEADVTGLSSSTYNGALASISDDGNARYWHVNDLLSDEYRAEQPAGAAWATEPSSSTA